MSARCNFRQAKNNPPSYCPPPPLGQAAQPSAHEPLHRWHNQPTDPSYLPPCMRTHDAGDTQFFDLCYPLLLGFLPQTVPTPVSMQEGVCVRVPVYLLNRCKTFTGVYIAYDRFFLFPRELWHSDVSFLHCTCALRFSVIIDSCLL